MSSSSNFVFLGFLILYPHPSWHRTAPAIQFLSSFCVVFSDYTAVTKLQEWNTSGCQEGQKEEDGFAWLNFILLSLKKISLKYWDNLFPIIEEWEGKLLKSMQTAFASRFLPTC